MNVINAGFVMARNRSYISFKAKQKLSVFRVTTWINGWQGRDCFFLIWKYTSSAQ